MPRLTSTPKSTQRRSRSVLASLFALMLIVGVTSGCETTDGDRLEVLRLVNKSRAESGLAAVRENTSLDLKADKWAQTLRDECGLRHSKLADGAPNEWRKLGENVGRGGSIDQIHTAYLNSPGHRANILDPKFNSMGTAAVYGQCRGQTWTFTVHVFMYS